MTVHRWSGWPGAWCLDCGQEDRTEIAIADGAYDEDKNGNPVRIHPGYENGPCPAPGSKQHDPYARWAELIAQGVCPLCSGDCGAANPPVSNCPMKDRST